MKSMQYFSRSGAAEPDGRTFDERTLQAVNLTAANIGSYREFAAALALAQSGSVITITESIDIPRGFKINVPNLTIRCVGRGALRPSEPDLTLFTFEDVEDCKLIDIIVNENGDTEFSTFVLFKSVYTEESPVFKGVTVRGCDVCSTNFFLGDVLSFIKNLSFDSVQREFVYNWARYKTYIQNNVHRSIVEPTNPPAFPAPSTVKAKAGVVFFAGGLYNCVLSNNTTEGFLDVFGTNNHIVGNSIYGYREVIGIETSIFVDNSGTDNIVTSNICGWAFNIGASSTDANNRTI